MIPYTTPLFFYCTAIILIPAIVLGIAGKSIRYYGLFASIFILILIFGQSYEQSIYLGVFYILSVMLIKGYYYLRKQYNNRLLIWCLVLIAVLPLIVSKTSGFFNLSLGFLGISYLTFRVVQMLLEIHDGLIKEVSIIDYTYFILFFPTISSGPIDRYRRFSDNLISRSGKEYIDILGDGLYKLFIGLGYKFVIGYGIYNYWLKLIPSHHTFLNVINYMYAYSFYLFFDFAGYSLIAIGISYILGIQVPENFNKPFISRDMKDFWQRWHMSLSFWFRDFVYTRFVMTALKRKWFGNKYTASYLGYLISFGLMGLWHGTQIFYLLYGFYQGILLILTDYYQRKSLFYKKYRNSWPMVAISILITFHLICFGFLIFSGYLFN